MFTPERPTPPKAGDGAAEAPAPVAEEALMSNVDPEALAREVRARAERLRLLSAQTQCTVLEFDAANRYVDVWSSDPSLLVRRREELLGKAVGAVHEEQTARLFAECVGRVMRTGHAETFECAFDVQRGRRCFSAHAVRVAATDYARPTVTFLLRDITDEKHLLGQLRRTERLAAVGVLAAGVAHEINNPLGYLMLNLERARASLDALTTAGGADAQQLATLLEPLRLAWEGADRVRRIVRELTAFTRNDDEVEQPVDLHALLDLAAETVSVEAISRASVRRDYGEVPSVVAKPRPLLQVFVNLLVNAAEAAAASEPHAIVVRTFTGAPPHGVAFGRSAVIEIRDGGTGIAPEALDQIFDPFFTTRAAGTGLGLSVCQNIVGALGGVIDVESELGRGTAFRVVLPAHDLG